MAGGLWFPELKTWFNFKLPAVRVTMLTEANRRRFSQFVVATAPLAGVVAINEVVGESSYSRVHITEKDGELVAHYFDEGAFNETDLIRFANVFKASIA